MLSNPFLSDVRAGDEIEGFYLLSNATVRSSSNGSRYLSAMLSDRSDSLEMKMWDYSGKIGPQENGSVVKVRGQVSDYRGSRQLTVKLLRLAEDRDRVRVEDLVPTAPISTEDTLRYIQEIIDSLQDEEYRRLADMLFSRHREAFRTVPAAKSVHHGFLGGLMMHTVNMLRTADFLADVYGEVIHRDLLLAGTLLHDLAKTREFCFSSVGLVKDYSTEGQLLGHPVMGAMEVAEAAKELGISEEKSLLLQHMLLSHHGEPDFGAAVRPMFAEAELLHLIDMIDSRMEIYAETLSTLKPGDFSERVFALEKKIYKLPEL